MDTRLNDRIEPLLSAATAVGAGVALDVRGAPRKALQAIGSTSAGSGSATILIQISNDGTNWFTAGTFGLTLTTTAANDVLVIEAPWAYIRANVTAISGTAASVSVLLGV